jgi:hypothetical protein
VAGPGLGDRGCAGIGKHIANRLLADGEAVVNVPPRLSARPAAGGKRTLLDTGEDRRILTKAGN